MADGLRSNDTIEDNADSIATELVVSRPRAIRRARWAEIVFLTALIVAAALALLAHRYVYFESDLTLAQRIQSVSLPGFDTLMTAVSLLVSGWLPWLLVLTTGLLLINAGLRIEGYITLAGPGLGWPVNMLLKLLIGRPRPSDALVHVSGKFYYESFHRDTSSSSLSSGFGVQGSEFRVQSSGFRVQGSEFRVQSSSFSLLPVYLRAGEQAEA
jgi:hypothetical protein